MKVKVPKVKSIYITSEFIKLDSLLKFASLASTGGEAKFRIQNGKVSVGNEVCTSRGTKIRPGDIIRCGDSVILLKASDYITNKAEGLRSKTDGIQSKTL